MRIGGQRPRVFGAGTGSYPSRPPFPLLPGSHLLYGVRRPELTYNPAFSLPSRQRYTPTTQAEFQAAIEDDATQGGGGLIVTPPGATWTAPLNQSHYLRKTGGPDTYIISSAYETSPPVPPGRRIDPVTHNATFTTLTVASNQLTGVPIVDCGDAANNVVGYRFVGIRFQWARDMTGTAAPDLIRLGYLPTQSGPMVDRITFDRCHIKGWRTKSDASVHPGIKAAIRASCRSLCVRDSDFADVGSRVWAFSGSVQGSSARGPWYIENNHLTGSIPIALGGDEISYLTGVVSDVTIRRNFFDRPLADGPWQPGYNEPVTWIYANGFEIKSGQRVLLEHNVWHNQWNAIHPSIWLIKSANLGTGEAAAAGVTAQDITMRYNYIRECAEWLRLNANDQATGTLSWLLHNVNAHDNVVRMGWNPGAASGIIRAFQFQGIREASAQFIGPERANWNMAQNSVINIATGGPSWESQLGIIGSEKVILGHGRFLGNIFDHGFDYGWAGNNGSGGAYSNGQSFTSPALASAEVGWNVLPNMSNSTPAGFSMWPNQMPARFTANRAAIGFQDYAAGNYRLASSSTHKGQGPGGRDPGADVDAVDAGTSGCITGVWP
jgi:hypothetical protein